MESLKLTNNISCNAHPNELISGVWMKDNSKTLICLQCVLEEGCSKSTKDILSILKLCQEVASTNEKIERVISGDSSLPNDIKTSMDCFPGILSSLREIVGEKKLEMTSMFQKTIEILTNSFT